MEATLVLVLDPSREENNSTPWAILSGNSKQKEKTRLSREKKTKDESKSAGTSSISQISLFLKQLCGFR
jgi:hypothetical protein